MNRDQLVTSLAFNCRCEEESLTNLDYSTLEAMERVARVANTARQGFKDGKGRAYRLNPDSGKWEYRDIDSDLVANSGNLVTNGKKKPSNMDDDELRRSYLAHRDELQRRNEDNDDEDEEDDDEDDVENRLLPPPTMLAFQRIAAVANARKRTRNQEEDDEEDEGDMGGDMEENGDDAHAFDTAMGKGGKNWMKTGGNGADDPLVPPTTDDLLALLGGGGGEDTDLMQAARLGFTDYDGNSGDYREQENAKRMNAFSETIQPDTTKRLLQANKEERRLAREEKPDTQARTAAMWAANLAVEGEFDRQVNNARGARLADRMMGFADFILNEDPFPTWNQESAEDVLVVPSLVDLLASERSSHR